MKIHCQYSELVEVAGLKEHPKNSNKHPTDQIERLARILEYQGWRYPVKVSRQTGYVTSGHGRILAAKLNGWKEVPVSFQDYEDETQEIADVTSDNAIASWAELDLGTINAFVPDLGPDFDLDLLGIKDFTLDAQDKFQGDEDAIPETPIEPKVKRGELWILGEHRLLIDDCAVPGNQDRLMGTESVHLIFTDPPYGMDIDTDYDSMFEAHGLTNNLHRHTGHRHKKIHGDDEPYDPTPILNVKAPQKFIWGCDWFYERLPGGGSFIAWDKRNESLDAVPGNPAEFCWAFPSVRRCVARILWSGHHGMQKDDSRTGRVHPTQKPTALAEWFFERWGKDAKNIWDGYLGSGSTLIACEKTNRKCFGMEIDAHYGQVIIERWQKFTGREAVREDGVKFSDLIP